MKTTRLISYLITGALLTTACGDDDGGSNEPEVEAGVDDADDDDSDDDDTDDSDDDDADDDGADDSDDDDADDSDDDALDDDTDDDADDDADDDSDDADDALDDDALDDDADDDALDDDADDDALDDDALDDDADDDALDDDADDDTLDDDALDDGSDDDADDDSTIDAGADDDVLDDGVLDDGVLDDGDEPDAGADDAADDDAEGGTPEADGGDAATDPVSPEAGTGEIGAAGGTFTNADGITLVIPPNSISTPSVIDAEPITAPDDENVVSVAWDFSPDGITFDPPATLTMPFDTGAAGGDEVAIAWYDGAEWVELTGCTTDDDSVTCPVDHFTIFAVVTVDSGSTGGGECIIPPCALELDFEECAADVADVCQAVFDDGAVSHVNVCYDNGVKAQIAGLSTEPLVFSVKKANGDPCYSFEVTGAETSTYSYSFKDSGGQEVMTGTVQSSNPDVMTYTCDGTQYVVDYSTEECSGDPSKPADTDTSGCTFGTCEY